MCFVFHAWAFDDVMIFEYLKCSRLIISRMRRAFKVKRKVFFPCFASFIHTKQTSKNVANTTFNDFYQQGQGIGQNSNFWALGPYLKSLQVASEKFVNLQ